MSLIHGRNPALAGPIVSGLANLDIIKFTLLFESRQTAFALLCITAAGLVVIVVAPDAVTALFGFVLTGLGCSSVYPLAISAAARRQDRPAAVNVAALGQTTFVVFFAGPPLLGFVAENFGIRSSYAVVIPVVLFALIVVRALRQPSGKISMHIDVV